MLTDPFPKEPLIHGPTPLEFMPNLTSHLQGPKLWIKRDDATGLAMGGNKARQLEFYVGQAKAQGANALLTTGAVQSNHVRMTIAAARKMGWHVEVQLEHRVLGRKEQYNTSGNPFLDKLMGATIHYYPEGEDEQGADEAMYRRAKQLEKQGMRPFVIPLSSLETPPWGALGYVDCVEEIVTQLNQKQLKIDAVILPTGSANTHAGMLAGITALGLDIPVYGFCVRREKQAQYERVIQKTHKVLDLLNVDKHQLSLNAIHCEDWVLGPGYGQLTQEVQTAIKMMAMQEGILLDPTYTGKSFAGLIKLIQNKQFSSEQNILFLHTGGTPALFGYPELLEIS